MEAAFGREIIFQAEPLKAITINYQDDVMIITSFAEGIERIFAVPEITDERESVLVRNFEPKHEALLLSYIFKNANDSNKVYYRTAVFPRNRNEYGHSPVVFRRGESGRLQIEKDVQQDIYMLRTVLDELGIKYELLKVD